MTTPKNPENGMDASKNFKRRGAWNKGQSPSDETKAKISSSLKGTKASPETRQKLSEARKGRQISPETRKKISDTQKGKPRWTDEDKARMSETRKGKSSHYPERKGWKLSEEARRKGGEARKGRVVSEEERARTSATHKGKKVSKETRHKLSEAVKNQTEFTRAKKSERQLARWAQKTEEEKSAQIERILTASQKITYSYIEKTYAQKLDGMGIIYEHQKTIGWYKVDFYIPAENKVIEINGCYWHACEQCHLKGRSVVEEYEKKREKDAKRYEYLRRKGYTVEIIWEHDLPRKS